MDEVFLVQVTQGGQACLAQMYNKPLQASVRAVTNGTLWALRREDFRGILTSEFSNLQSLKLLRSVDLLSRLTILQLSLIADSLSEVSFSDGQTIVNKGDDLSGLYMVQKGRVRITFDSYISSQNASSLMSDIQKDDDNDGMNNGTELSMEKSEGTYFGEWTLFGECIDSLRVVALGNVVCAVLTKEKFESVVGPLPKFLQDEYRSRETSSDFPREPARSIDPSVLSKVQLSDLEWKTCVYSTDCCEIGLVQPKDSEHSFSLKRFSKQKIKKLGKEEQVLKEKTLIKNVNASPGVPQVLCTCADQSHVGILLNTIISCPIASILHSPLDETSARFCAASVVVALEELHKAGILYRGVSPEVLMFSQLGHVQLVDFRFGKKLSSERTFTICGMVDSLAPEIVQGKGHSFAADWWALGVLIYFMLQSEMPFGSWRENELDTFAKIAKGQFTLPETFSPEVVDLITKLLEVDEKERLGSKGVDSLKSHNWFNGVNWESIRNGSCTAPQEILSRIDQYLETRPSETTAPVVLATEDVDELNTPEWLDGWTVVMGDLLIRGGISPIQSLVSTMMYVHQDYNNGTGIISPFLPQALFDDIFSRLLALTSYIRNRFIQFFEDLVYRDVNRFSEDFVALSSCQDLDSSNRKSASASCASTSKNLGTVLDERTQEPSSIEDHSSLLSRCEIIERKFFYGVLVHNFRLDLARYFVKSTLLLALAPYQISSQCVKHAQIRVKSTLSRVQITFHGSSADIGWMQRDPTMDPVKDGSDRFVELLNAIRNGEHKLPDSYVYLLIPGLFSNHGPLYFVSTKRFFSKMGLACHIAKIHSEASVEYNSLILKQYIEELYWGSGKRVMLLGHSKGGVDAAAALSLYWSDLKGKVAGLALVQSPYGGTPIASDIMREGQIADKETRRIMKLIVCKIIKGDIKSLEDLTYEKRKQFLSQHKLPKGIPLISFRSEANVGPGVISMMSHIAHVELPKLSFLGNTSDESEYEVGPAEKHRVPLVVPVSAAMALSALHLQLRYGEKSDGLVTCRDAEVPGSVVVRPNQKLDHAWMVYSSWNKNQAGADASEMCEALLTMLVELGKADNSGIKQITAINPNDGLTLTSNPISTIENQLNEADLVVDAENLLIETEIQDVYDLNVDTDTEENLVLAPEARRILELDEKDDSVKLTCIGQDITENQLLQYTTPPNVRFGAFPTNDYDISTDYKVVKKAPRDAETHFSLVGCTVAPAFQFEDFVLAKRYDLYRFSCVSCSRVRTLSICAHLKI
ncbi:protein phosphatase 2C and cyclic nucleotide-binding/kinase domain-containing protein [Tanacetum coccineum]